jgi:RNA polymerase sigma-70 factor (ECF subfamily)
VRLIDSGRERLQDGCAVSRDEPANVRDPLLEVARSAAGGDRGAQRTLLEAAAPAMTAAVRAMVPRAELDDAMQEALVALIRSLPSFRFECSVKHFACRVASRSASVHNRTRTRRARSDDLGRPASEEIARDPDRDARRRGELLRELLMALPEAQAEAFALRVVLGYTLEEVASATGAPSNTVRSRLRLAKEALHARISGDPSLKELFEVAP